MKKSQQRQKRRSHAELSSINPNAAGIDIGADRHWVSVPEGRDIEKVRSFSCFTGDLYQMADWLAQCKVETVAMESTGVYWLPVFQVLESRGFEGQLILMNRTRISHKYLYGGYNPCPVKTKQGKGFDGV